MKPKVEITTLWGAPLGAILRYRKKWWQVNIISRKPQGIYHLQEIDFFSKKGEYFQFPLPRGERISIPFDISRQISVGRFFTPI